MYVKYNKMMYAGMHTHSDTERDREKHRHKRQKKIINYVLVNILTYLYMTLSYLTFLRFLWNSYY